MPDVNGRELASEILTQRPGLKVIFISGYTEHVMLQQGAIEKGLNFISKPFAMQSLARKLREVLDSARP
jgi:YesN/AraC family two-component response regulator